MIETAGAVRACAGYERLMVKGGMKIVIYEAECFCADPMPMDEGTIFTIRFVAANRKQAIGRLKRYLPTLITVSLKTVKS